MVDARVAYGPSSRRWEIAVIEKNLTRAKVVDNGGVFGGSPGTSLAALARDRSVAISFTIRR